MSETPITPPPPGASGHYGQASQSSARGPQPTIGELIARISENVSGLIQGEIDLAKAKGKRMVTNLGVGAVLLAAAGVLALFAFGILLGGLVRLLALALPLWASYIIVLSVCQSHDSEALPGSYRQSVQRHVTGTDSLR